MYKVTNIDYEIIKDSALFDKEAERVYKMYTHPDIKIFVIEDRNKPIALCIAYVGEDNISCVPYYKNRPSLVPKALATTTLYCVYRRANNILHSRALYNHCYVPNRMPRFLDKV